MHNITWVAILLACMIYNFVYFFISKNQSIKRISGIVGIGCLVMAILWLSRIIW